MTYGKQNVPLLLLSSGLLIGPSLSPIDLKNKHIPPPKAAIIMALQKGSEFRQFTGLI